METQGWWGFDDFRDKSRNRSFYEEIDLKNLKVEHVHFESLTVYRTPFYCTFKTYMNGTKRDETIKQRVKDKQTEESGHRDHEKQT